MEKVIVLSEEEVEKLINYLESKDLDDSMISLYNEILERYYLLKGIIK
ncbi:hypothetical protein TwortDSMZ_053 [Staphylococcus phage Twort]|uniref:Uncharacterized protein n=2 Tax=Staphylococcus phage Twort (strain DSM 17442 / HER 48) TaxID=2908167 RepID=A0A6H0X558_BPTWO|nr:ORF191 [Staphylococcus phage Twort]AAX92455.1 ORF191 [Staphylococcus phage Twort]QIW89058.1 hypothetical protein TwortDSMZ_053 [Staphylococcus phage Twort]